MHVRETIHNRRSARSFKQTHIGEEVLREMLEAARLAPSAGNGQSHIFGIVDDADTKTALAKAAGSQMWIAEAPVVIACCARLEADLRDLPEEDFGLMVNRTRFGRPFLDYLNAYGDRTSVGTLFANAAPLIPAEHMFLTAVAHGLAACFVGYLDVAEASRILRLPEDTVCLYLLPVGYPADEPKEKACKPVQEISFRNTYGILAETAELPQTTSAEEADSSRTICPAESPPSSAPTGNVTVRHAQPEDIQALYEMNELFNGPGTTTMELLADGIRHNNRETVLIAEADGQPAGFCCVQLTTSMCYSTNYAEITELFVREEYRRQGVASALMDHAENCFQDQQVRSYQLFTGKTNTTAQCFYEQNGYIRSDELMYRKRL
ncbi:MAG: hypothetical protein K0Q90_3686 [Paenibacillaceae bacterium]|nr:hypothetical protein [Paenibacillaceae bacterium]